MWCRSCHSDAAVSGSFCGMPDGADHHEHRPVCSRCTWGSQALHPSLWATANLDLVHISGGSWVDKSFVPFCYQFIPHFLAVLVVAVRHGRAGQSTRQPLWIQWIGLWVAWCCQAGWIAGAGAHSGVDSNLFWGGEIISSQGGGRSFGPKPEDRNPRPETKRGWGSWGEAASPFHQLWGLEERCKLPQRGPGVKLRKIWNLRLTGFTSQSGLRLTLTLSTFLGAQNSLQKCLITCKLLQKGC